jgi:CubicO group peptidase (beta-lactamase class C family)
LVCARHRGAEPGFDRLDGKRLTMADIDGEVDRLMRAARIPGLALGLIEHGRVVYAKAYGQRDSEGKLLLTTDTIMSGASLTKSAIAEPKQRCCVTSARPAPSRQPDGPQIRDAGVGDSGNLSLRELK